jgi:uncharacterized protein YkwD
VITNLTGVRPLPLLWLLAAPAGAPADGVDAATECGEADDRLEQVAAIVATRVSQGEAVPDTEPLSFELRRVGAPFVWPRAWVFRAQRLDESTLAAKVRDVSRSIPTEGSRRCGVARRKDEHGGDLAVVVSADALGDWERTVPTRGRVGQWIDVRIRASVPFTAAKVIVLSPSGQPKSLLTSVQGASISGRFALEAPGPFTVQVVAETARGPRPIAEANVFADMVPPASYEESLRVAPGEAAAAGHSGAAALAAMVDALRAEAGLSPLTRDARLDLVALAHANRMKAAGAVGHDLGEGNPAARVAASGVAVRSVGENVAHAGDVVRAHRALYASPSHRANLMRAEYTHVGLAVSSGEKGDVWVCEVFTAN